jgi:hypothetical protein
MSAAIIEAAKELAKNAGISLAASRRIIRKINLMAQKVDWAEPIAHPTRGAGRSNGRQTASKSKAPAGRASKAKRR